ncbi:MAG: hypothetical protein KDC34_06765 [Saprospiraceae bacterium]|nr:hypothetical protein [Saprospiraceae bacterium]
MQKRILVGALNWGLGHATRSIPIIRALQEAGTEVFLASDGQAAQLWEAEFPELPLAILPGYNIRYPSGNLSWHLGTQVPKIAMAIRKEKVEAQKLVAQWNIQGIISDHRYGFQHTGIPSALVCHQMQILAPNALSGWLINRAHRSLLHPFDFHWVPDHPESPGMAGQLSHGYPTKQMRFIGPLSRLHKKPASIKWDYLVVLSGPEPQRSILESLILEQTPAIRGSWLIVGGTPDTTKNIAHSTITYKNFLTTIELEEALNAANIVVCRSGYSSIMDLMKLEKRALLIPTPGQTEQEYLAELHRGTGLFSVAQQSGLRLGQALRELNPEKGETPKKENDLLSAAIRDFLDHC